MRPSLWAIIVLVVLVLLLFGARKLPELAGNVGKSLKIFRKEIRELVDDEDSQPSSPPVPSAGAHERSGRLERDAAGDDRRAPP